MSEAVSGRNCAETGYFFGFRGLFESHNDELPCDLRNLVGIFPADGTGYFAGGAGNFSAAAGNSHGRSGNPAEPANQVAPKLST